MRSFIIGSFVASLALVSLPAVAGTPAPNSESAPAAAFPVFTWKDVDAAVKAGATLVDARGAEQFAAGHIAGAINIPFDDATALAKLPADKSTQVIFYCGGPACSASTKCAGKVAELGYSKVAEYKGGYPEWKSLQPKAN